MSSDPRAASIPNTRKTSTQLFDSVRETSTPSTASTSLRFVPSVSSTYSFTEFHSPVSGSTRRVALSCLTMNTLLIPGTPLREISESICCARLFRNTSSSPSTSLSGSLSTIRMRNTSSSALSSECITNTSRPNMAPIFDATCAIDRFLSSIWARSSTKRSSHGDWRSSVASTSSSGIAKNASTNSRSSGITVELGSGS